MTEVARATDNAPFGQGGPQSDGTGHIVIRLDRRETSDTPDLRQLAADEGFQHLLEFLTTNAHLDAERIIRHVTPEIIRSRELVAASTAFTPLESLTAYWRIDVRQEDDAETLRSALHGMPEINIAYHETEVRDAATGTEDITSNIYERDQHFLDAAPSGIGARDVWKKQNGEGHDVRVIDLEGGWILAHEDLPGPQLLYGSNGCDDPNFGGDHGAAALGIVGGVNNDLGIIGVAPRIASLNVVSHYDAAKKTALHVADAIDAAAKHLRPGDILMLEVQRFHEKKALPTEIESADLHAIRHAVAQGVIVIEAAGNSGFDLDSWSDPTGQHTLDMNAPGHTDSGAIVVGSSYATVVRDPGGFEGHRRYYTSNYGSRVNNYAWGEQIYTTGYGTIAGTSGATNSYTASFGQTSGATAIIAGAAALVQSWYKGAHGEPLTPEAMRATLSNAETATPQAMSGEGTVGVMPDLAAIMVASTAANRRVAEKLDRVRRATGVSRDPFEEFKVPH